MKTKPPQTKKKPAYTAIFYSSRPRDQDAAVVCSHTEARQQRDAWIADQALQLNKRPDGTLIDPKITEITRFDVYSYYGNNRSKPTKIDLRKCRLIKRAADKLGLSSKKYQEWIELHSLVS